MTRTKQKVYSKRFPGIPENAVYVGRPSKWGNPYGHKPSAIPGTVHVAAREEAIARYERYLAERPDLVAQAKAELRGKDLVCWCAPEACHADVLVRIANE